MTDELEPVDEKTNFLQAFADMRPDLFFPDNWSVEQRNAVKGEMSSGKVRTGMYAEIPMQCKGPSCPYARVCPLLARNEAPIGYKCPIEMGIVIEFANNYMREFGVDQNNLVEAGMVRDLVDFEVQYMRSKKILAQEHFIMDNPVGIDSDGNVVVQAQLHPAVEMDEKILKRKERLLNAFLATREARNKAGQGVLDASTQLANLMDAVRDYNTKSERLVLEKLGVNVRDEYIEANVRDSEDDESDE